MLSDSKAVVLERIQRATGEATALEAAQGEWTQLDRMYRQRSDATQQELVERLTDRLLDYDARVYGATAEDVRDVIRSVLTDRDKPRMIVARGFPADWIPESQNVTADTGFDHAGLDEFDGVMTGATVAIAETGTIVLQHQSDQGRRAMTLIPDYHLCVVKAQDVVGTVPEAMQRLAASSTLPTTFVSGPSATADIEMTRIKGVHGPRFLDVVLIF
jgi:L-lactate dehydrogenase complex protein LldG